MKPERKERGFIQKNAGQLGEYEADRDIDTHTRPHIGETNKSQTTYRTKIAKSGIWRQSWREVFKETGIQWTLRHRSW